MCVFVWVCTHHATPPHHSSNCSHWNWTFWKRSGLHTPFSPVLFFESVDVSTYPFSAHSPPFVPWTQVSCHFPWNHLCALTWWSACSMSTIVWRTSKPMLWSALSLGLCHCRGGFVENSALHVPTSPCSYFYRPCSRAIASHQSHNLRSSVLWNHVG